MKVSRREVMSHLSSAAVALAVTAPVVAYADPLGALIEANDPILTAITAHRRSLHDYEVALDARSALEAALPNNLRQSHWDVWAEGDDWIVPEDALEWIEAERAVFSASEKADEIALQMFDHLPTTLAGVAALLRYMHEDTDQALPEDLQDDDGEYATFRVLMMKHLADVVERLA